MSFFGEPFWGRNYRPLTLLTRKRLFFYPFWTPFSELLVAFSPFRRTSMLSRTILRLFWTTRRYRCASGKRARFVTPGTGILTRRYLKPTKEVVFTPKTILESSSVDAKSPRNVSGRTRFCQESFTLLAPEKKTTSRNAP